MLISGRCRTQLPAIPPEPQKEGSLSSPIYNQPETQKRDAYKEILWGKLCPDAPIHKKVDRLRSGPQHKDSLSSCLTVTVGPLYIIYFIVSRLSPKPFPRAGGLYELLSVHGLTAAFFGFRQSQGATGFGSRHNPIRFPLASFSTSPNHLLWS